MSNKKKKPCLLCKKLCYGTICRECFRKKGRSEARKRYARNASKRHRLNGNAAM
jgi:hypothetical protein